MPGREQKYAKLLRLLETYPKLAVAFSGGVDSTLLLHAAIAAKGPSAVVAFHLRSALQSSRSEERCQEVLMHNFSPALRSVSIEMKPLEWPDLTANDQQRCYLCKKRMFSAILAALPEEGCEMLADGTNGDDIHQPRPGLRAIAELGVKSPLVEVNLSKQDIRQLAKDKGLTNFNLPSNSCLATRLSTGLRITQDRLGVIEKAEQFLEDIGFSGCRVRMCPTYIMVEVPEGDVERFARAEIRRQVHLHFSSTLPLPAMLSLVGR